MTLKEAEPEKPSLIKMPVTLEAPKEEQKKKPLIQVVRKQPTFTIFYNDDNSVMTFTVYCSKEESAADIQCDVSEKSLVFISEQ